MAAVVVYLALEPRNGGAPVTLARIEDRGALVAAARSAIQESESKVGVMRSEDVDLGLLQEAETRRLTDALEHLVPELRGGVH